jgi:hypothetical protein
MTSLISFKISESQNIEIVIDKQNKVNIYGYQVVGLHIFDEVEVQYIHDGEAITLARDIIREIINTFVVTLEKALKKELLLEEVFIVGKVGYFFNKITYTNTNELKEKNDIFSEYWVWSSPKNVQTWLYNVDGKIYLEISPTYPWLFLDPDEDELYTSFDDYMKNYKPIAIVELQETLVRTWINQCHMILEKIETV